MNNYKEYLEKIYFDPEHPGSYQGLKTLYDIVKKEGKYKISHKQIKDFLESKQSYSTNKRVKRQFQRQQVLVSGIDVQHEADLASLVPYADDNNGYKYLLVVIDTFSRFAWIQPLKDKSAKEIVQAFKKIYSEGRIPKSLRTDRGRDFTSKEFKNFVEKENINHFTTSSEKQANYVERFIKTIKSKIFRYIIESKSNKYIDKLQSLVDSYNKTWHSGIQSEPVNVNKQNERKLWWQMYWPKEKYIKKEKTTKKDSKRFKFKVGDRVRISYLSSAFQREYNAKWSNEIFQIYRRYMSYKLPKYKIKDWFNDKIEGAFYQHELQKVTEPSEDLYTIDTVSNYKGKGKNKTVRVHWKGWPKKFDTIFYESDIKDIEK